MLPVLHIELSFTFLQQRCATDERSKLCNFGFVQRDLGWSVCQPPRLHASCHTPRNRWHNHELHFWTYHRLVFHKENKQHLYFLRTRIRMRYNPLVDFVLLYGSLWLQTSWCVDTGLSSWSVLLHDDCYARCFQIHTASRLSS